VICDEVLVEKALTQIFKYKYDCIEQTQTQAALSNLWDVNSKQSNSGEPEIRFQSTAVGSCLVYQSIVR